MKDTTGLTTRLFNSIREAFGLVTNKLIIEKNTRNDGSTEIVFSDSRKLIVYPKQIRLLVAKPEDYKKAGYKIINLDSLGHGNLRVDMASADHKVSLQPFDENAGREVIKSLEDAGEPIPTDFEWLQIIKDRPQPRAGKLGGCSPA